MLGVLQGRLRLLARSEDGVAVVTTLAVFMFAFLVIVGVYAVGTAVRERIHLQNACDAASYSAAVVQADSLSRIATINRAMSWTYVQMTRRQMDYIVYRWLDHTLAHFNQDKAAALAWYLTSLPPPPCPLHASWGMDGKIFGAGAKINLNNTHRETPSRISSANGTFKSSHLSGQRGAFYSQSATISGLGAQIKDDKATIKEMNRAIDDIAQKIPQRVETTVEEVLKANVQDTQRSRCRWKVWQNDNPLAGAEGAGDGYLRYLRNTLDDETHFLRWSGYEGGPSTVFDTGIDTWFTRGNEWLITPGAVGLQRSYLRYPLARGNALFSQWTWWSTKSIGCELTPLGWVHGHYLMLQTCPHIGLEDRCQHKRTEPYLAHMRYIHEATFYGNMSCVWNDQYEGEKARPLVLRKEYFGERGAISVGLAQHNDNPWKIILGDVTKGVFTAFNPFSEWTWCFSTARAGYKKLGEDPTARAYYVDWKSGSWASPNQRWNLCQSDWDACLIPVRRAKSQAADGSWGSGDTSFLRDWTGDSWKWLSGSVAFDTWQEMRAGGNDARVDADVAAWGDVALGGSERGPAAARAWTSARQWQIGKPNQKLNWAKLTDVMFH